MKELNLQDQLFIKAIVAYIKSDRDLYIRSDSSEFFDLLDHVEKDIHVSLSEFKNLVIHVLYTYDNDINKLIIFYLNYYLDKEINKLFDSLDPIISEENINKTIVNLRNIIYNHESIIGCEIDKHFIFLMKNALRGEENCHLTFNDCMKIDEIKKYEDINLSIKNESNVYPVKLNDKWGLAKLRFAEIIPCKYDVVYSLTNELALVRLKDKYGLINEEGKEIISCKYDDVFSFDTLGRGLALVRLNNKWGFINKKGEEVISCKYDECELLHDDKIDLIKLKMKNKWGLVDLQGKEIIPCEYDRIMYNEDSDGIFLVQKDDKLGFIDLKSDSKKFIIFENEFAINQKIKIQFSWYKDNYIISTSFYYGYLNEKFEKTLIEIYKYDYPLIYDNYAKVINRLKEDRNIIKKLSDTMKYRIEDFVVPIKQLFKDFL